MFILWHWSSLQGGEAERMKLSECVTRPQLVVVSLSFISKLCHTHTGQFSTCDKYDVVWIHGLLLRLKEAISPPFTCPPLVSRAKGHAILPSMSSIVWGAWAGQKPWIAHHLSCVIIRHIEAGCGNTSRRTYYLCNSLLRDTSLAWCTQSRLSVRITPDPLQLLTGIRCRQNNWIQRAVQDRGINMHGMQYHVTCAQLSVVPVVWCPEWWLLCLRIKREKLTFISSAVCSPI